MTAPYTVRARNTAVLSENKMHDDTVAATFGFRGGLVPGVEVYAYMTHVPAERWGIEWLAHGFMQARLVHPTYDGEVVTVADDLTTTNADGEVCATGSAELQHDVGVADVPDIEHRPMPSTRPPADERSLEPGTVLGTYEAGFHADRASDYLLQIGETLPLYDRERVAHPGWLIRMANWALSNNVVLGPWIHVETATHHLGLVRDGAHVEVRAAVADRYDRKGHKFVLLDEVFLADGQPVSYVKHTAIYEPRRDRARAS